MWKQNKSRWWLGRRCITPHCFFILQRLIMDNGGIFPWWIVQQVFLFPPTFSLLIKWKSVTSVIYLGIFPSKVFLFISIYYCRVVVCGCCVDRWNEAKAYASFTFMNVFPPLYCTTGHSSKCHPEGESHKIRTSFMNYQSSFLKLYTKIKGWILKTVTQGF